MADALEVNLLSFMSICAGVEFGLNDNEISSITSVVFVGQFFGSIFWGPIADAFGRKRSYFWAYSLIVGGGFLSSIAPNFGWLIFFRALVGFGIGGATVPFDLLAEFLPTSQRGTFLMYIEYFWTIGSLFVCGMAWAILPTAGWRILAFVIAIPVAITFLISLFLLPESPRWLVSKGRIREAEEVIHSVAKWNGVNIDSIILDPLAPSSSQYSLVAEADQESSRERDAEGVVGRAGGRRGEEREGEGIILEVESTFYDLIMTKEIRRISFPLWTIWLCFGFCYYGVVLFVSRLYDTTSSNIKGSLTCSFDYPPIFINACAEFVGITVAVFLVDRIGRTRTQASTYLIAGLGAFSMGLGLSHAPSALLAVAWIARCFAMTSSSGTWVATPELYPTNMRATGHSVSNSMARIGGFLAPYLVMNMAIPPSVVGIILLVGNLVAASCALLLPETMGQKLDDAINHTHPLTLSELAHNATTTFTLYSPIDQQQPSTVKGKNPLHIETDATSPDSSSSSFPFSPTSSSSITRQDNNLRPLTIIKSTNPMHF